MKDYILKLDKSRQLRYGFKALKLIRDKFGDKSLDQLMGLKMDEIPTLIWAGLKWEEPNLSIEKVTGMLDDAIPNTYTILEVTMIGLEALSAQMGIDTKKVLADVQAQELHELQKKKKAKQPVAKQVIPSAQSSKKLQQPNGVTTPLTTGSVRLMVGSPINAIKACALASSVLLKIEAGIKSFLL